MSTREEKEKQQEALDEQKYKKSQQMAILKASNQMLEDAKDAITDKLSGDERQMKKMHKLIDEAKEENLNTGKNYLQAVPQDIENSVYHEANEYYKNKYKQHLETNNLTDEELHNKSYGTPVGNHASVVMSSKSKKEEEKKWFSFMKKKNEKSEDGEEILTEIDQTKRTVKGDGYIETDVDDKDGETIMKDIVKDIQNDVVKQPTVDVNKTIEEKLDIKPRSDVKNYPDFDPSSINPLTRYDIIELPSHGECYASKKSRIPVRELTAADENLIASPNMYANGQLIDTILRRCILDKNFDVDAMCPGDRDAVVLWLRATAYGPEYEIKSINPSDGKIYNSKINLGDFNYKEFNLKGDENGYFDYKFDNGDTVKFKILSYKEMTQLQEDIALQYINQKKYIVYQKINDIKYQVDEVFRNETRDEALNDAIDYIHEWANNDSVIKDEDTLYSNFMTSSIIRRTVSVNGNDDPKYIEEYINGLRIAESKKYREYIFKHTPGIDFSITVNIPESEGGGSFDSTFQYSDTIFIA